MKSQILVRVINVSFIWLLLGCSQAPIQSNLIGGNVERIVSGQTLEVMIDGKDQTERVRIVGINVVPSKNWQTAAKKGLQTLIGNGKIYLELEFPERDNYDRILAHVWHNKALVGEELAKQGYVLANTKYPHQYSDRIFNAQESARILGYGIWSPETQ